MVDVRLCELVRLGFFFASPRHFDFFSYKTETLKCLKLSTRHSDFKTFVHHLQQTIRALQKIEALRQPYENTETSICT